MSDKLSSEQIEILRFLLISSRSSRSLSVEVKRFSFPISFASFQCLISYTCTKKRYFICLICGDTMSFVQKIERLLEERNIQKKKMLEDLNLNINTFSVWRKSGTIPSAKVLQKIADSHGVSLVQVILRWNLQKGVVVIPGSANPDQSITISYIWEVCSCHRIHQRRIRLRKDHQGANGIQHFVRLLNWS